MITFPEIIKIKIIDELGNGVPNISVKLKLFSRHKNNYYFIIPISNKKGLIEITRKWIESEIEKERNLSPADFSSNLTDCELKLELKIMSENDLLNALNGRRLYQQALNISNDEILELSQTDNKYYDPTLKSVLLQGNSVEEIILKTTRK